eukprot:scaffold41711_cov81-Phaeocystis_antarctica.AAC.1
MPHRSDDDDASLQVRPSSVKEGQGQPGGGTPASEYILYRERGPRPRATVRGAFAQNTLIEGPA